MWKDIEGKERAQIHLQSCCATQFLLRLISKSGHMGNFLNPQVSSFLWSEGMTGCWHTAILGDGKDKRALQALTCGGVRTYTLTHRHLVTGVQFGKGSSTAASVKWWTSAINHKSTRLFSPCEVCWGGRGEFGLVLTGYTNTLVIIFCFQSSEVVRLLLV